MIRSTQVDGIFHIELNRAERKNALIESMYTALVEQLIKADNDPEISVILLTAQGDMFCAGHDLDYFLNDPPKSGNALPFAFLEIIAAVKKPIIAAVNGLAVGIGATLLLHCDIIYASPNASFSFPFVSLGLSPEGASSYYLPQLFGHQRASEILFFNDKLSVVEAKACGLVNQIVPSELLLNESIQQARKLAQQPHQSLIETKALLKAPERPLVRAQMKLEAEVFCNRVTSASAKEAFAAFLDKRPPNFNGLD